MVIWGISIVGKTPRLHRGVIGSMPLSSTIPEQLSRQSRTLLTSWSGVQVSPPEPNMVCQFIGQNSGLSRHRDEFDSRTDRQVYAPFIQRPRIPPFHGGYTSSNLVRCTKFYAGVLLGEDSAFQADGEGSNPFTRSNLSRCSIMALRWSPKPVMAVRIRPPRPVCRFSSVGQSSGFVNRRSSVRIRQPAPYIKETL